MREFLALHTVKAQIKLGTFVNFDLIYYIAQLLLMYLWNLCFPNLYG